MRYEAGNAVGSSETGYGGETMTRIVFYNHTGQMSGAEKMLLLGLTNLPRDQFDPVLVCPEPSSLSAAAAARGLKVYAGSAVNARFTINPFLLIRYLLSLLASLQKLRRVFKELKPDIIHANTVRAGIATTLSTSGMKTPVVWHNHDMLPTRHPLTFAIRMLIWASGRVWLVACSRAAADTLTPLIRGQRCASVIYNGCEADREVPDDQWRAQRRWQLNLSPEDFVVVTVAQITPRKRQLETIRAFARARVHAPNARLIVCGAPLFNDDTFYLQRLVAEVRDLGLEHCVHFTGYREDAVEIIAASDLCILNSSKEPFALTIVEAMICGTPVIASDCGGPKEIIHHGINGEIVPVNDNGELERAIVRLAADAALRKRYAGAAALWARDRFSREGYILNWCALYEEVLNGETRVAEYAHRSADLEVSNGARQ
jgi:glycosyltransferase involved in cell wall biosynthesis